MTCFTALKIAKKPGYPCWTSSESRCPDVRSQGDDNSSMWLHARTVQMSDPRVMTTAVCDYMPGLSRCQIPGWWQQQYVITCQDCPDVRSQGDDNSSMWLHARTVQMSDPRVMTTAVCDYMSGSSNQPDIWPCCWHHISAMEEMSS